MTTTAVSSAAEAVTFRAVRAVEGVLAVEAEAADMGGTVAVAGKGMRKQVTDERGVSRTVVGS